MIPGAFRDLLLSEKGFAGGMLIVASTVLVAIGKLSPEAWQAHTQWIFTAYVTAKTVQGSVTTVSAARAAAWEPMPVKE